MPKKNEREQDNTEHHKDKKDPRDKGDQPGVIVIGNARHTLLFSIISIIKTFLHSELNYYFNSKYYV